MKPPYDNETVTEYANDFQQAMRSALLPLPTAAQQPNSGVFSSSCYHHCSINSDAFWGIYVGDMNLKVSCSSGRCAFIRHTSCVLNHLHA